MSIELVIDDNDILDEDIVTTAEDLIDDQSAFDSDESQRKLNISSDDILDSDPATTVIISNIGKRHSDEIRENLYQLTEDRRAHDSLHDSNSTSD